MYNTNCPEHRTLLFGKFLFPIFLIVFRKEVRRRILEKYSIVSLLSSHPDSDVWLAEHRLLKVKRIIKGLRKSSPLHERLVLEAHLLKNLKHPNIPEIYDFEEDAEYSYIIEEYIEGQSMKNLCMSRVLSEREIFHFIIQVSSIIEYLHRLPEKIIYLDIKPENVIVCQDSCYLIDFGSAKEQGRDDGYSFGTRGYAAPEQFEGGAGQRSDIFALGKLLQYMTLHANVVPKRKAQLQKIIEGCCEKKYWNRISSAAEFRMRIERVFKKINRLSEKNFNVVFIGGAQNTGTTYLALLFCLYLENQKKTCAYVETEDSMVSAAMERECQKRKSIAGLNTVSCKYWQAGRLPDSTLIFDYGVLRRDMPEEVYEADITCVVVTESAWDMKELMRIRALSHRCRRCLFIVNLTERASEDTIACLGGESVVTFPYCPELEAACRGGAVTEALEILALRMGFFEED